MDIHYPAFEEVRHRIWDFTFDIQSVIQEKLGNKLLFNELNDIICEIEDMQSDCTDDLKEMFGKDDA